MCVPTPPLAGFIFWFYFRQLLTRLPLPVDCELFGSRSCLLPLHIISLGQGHRAWHSVDAWLCCLNETGFSCQHTVPLPGNLEKRNHFLLMEGQALPWVWAEPCHLFLSESLGCHCWGQVFCRQGFSGEAALCTSLQCLHFTAELRPRLQPFPDLITRNGHWPGLVPLIPLSLAPPRSARDAACTTSGRQLHANTGHEATIKISFLCLTFPDLPPSLLQCWLTLQRQLTSALLLTLQIARCTQFLGSSMKQPS